MARADSTFEALTEAPWLRVVVLPLLLFVVALAIVCALVLSGAVQGDRTLSVPAEPPKTQPTVLIQP